MGVKGDWGFRLLGLCAVVIGLAQLWFGQIFQLEQQTILGNEALRLTLLASLAAADVAGGIAMQFTGAMRAGAAIVGASFTVLALLQLADGITQPGPYLSWIGAFETLGIVCGAAMVVARSAPSPNERLMRGAVLLFAVCNVSYALAQVVFLGYTVSLVPGWMPLGQMFWTITTTAAFALAAGAFFTGVAQRLAARLLTVMVALFGLLIWVPALASAPLKESNWSEITVNYGIAAAAWILADASRRRSNAGVRSAATA